MDVSITSKFYSVRPSASIEMPDLAAGGATKMFPSSSMILNPGNYTNHGEINTNIQNSSYPSNSMNSFTMKLCRQ